MAEDKNEQVEQAEDREAIEYSIHVFHHPRDVQKGKEPSEKTDTMNDMDKAFKIADKLAQSGEYQRVEVKKKYEEESSGRMLDMTLKVFEFRPKKPMSVGVLAGIAVACGAVAFGVTYLVAQMLAAPAG